MFDKMGIKQGGRVTVTCEGHSTVGTVVLCSDNKESLAVTLDEGMNTRLGLFVNGVALLLRDGHYQELGTGIVFEIAVTQ